MKMARSHHGCKRCKRRRQRCDEQKPVCIRCASAGAAAECDYHTLDLKWNGRVPRPDSLAKRATEAKIPPRPPQPRSLDALEAIPARHRKWLYHFVTHAAYISSGQYVQEQINLDVLPMSLTCPSLMHALTASAELHYHTMCMSIPDSYCVERSVSLSMDAAFRSLYEEIKHEGGPGPAQLHTIRTLLHCEIYSGQSDGAWQRHVDAARAMVKLLGSRPRTLEENPRAKWIWERWYRTLRTLTSVAHLDEDSPAQHEPFISWEDANSEFDLYAGCSKDASIAMIAVERLIRSGRNSGFDEQHAAQLTVNASRMESVIRKMIARDRSRGLLLPSFVSMTSTQLAKYEACNMAHQYAALVLLYKQVMHLDSASREIQECVEAVCKVALAIRPVTKPSPWVLLNTPLFIVGQEARGEYRDTIKSCLGEMYSVFGVRNIQRCVDLLVQHWWDSDAGLQTMGHMDPIFKFVPY